MTRTTGKRCRRDAVKGSEVCGQHVPERIEFGPTTVPRCKAHSKTNGGRPCKYPAIPGGTVCRWHGGSTQASRRAAALKLISLVDPAIGTLAREMVRAERSSDRQRAANSILDRAGVVRRTDGGADTARALLIDRLRSLRDGVVDGDPAALEVLEAEVVDD